MMKPELLLVQDLSVSYGENHVIKNIGFSLHPGEFTALLGLNGSGKTTLLRAICGLKKASSGSCFVNGNNCLDFHEKQRARFLSYIPQRHSIVYDTSVMDVILMGFNASFGFFQTPGKKEQKLVLEALEKLGLETLKDESFLHLSEGQKQLVILARTMVQNAPIMLLDEPDSALDFVNRHMVLSKIKDSISKNAKCGLITLHDPNFALQYCDRLLLLSGGSICAEINSKMDPSQIKNNLSKIYGDIALLEHRSNYVMIKE